MSDEELRAVVREGWAAAERADPTPTVQYFAALLAAHPSSAFVRYQCARSHDYAGQPELAAPLYEAAIAAGLADVDRRRALTSHGSTLRNLGRFTEAVAVLQRAQREFPGDVLSLCYLALALHDAGRPALAVAHLLDLTLAAVDDPDLLANRWALGNYAAALARGTWSADGAASLPLTGPLLDTASADRTAVA